MKTFTKFLHNQLKGNQTLKMSTCTEKKEIYKIFIFDRKMNILILRGEKVKRMKSSIPKVLHLFHGKPMIVCILEESLLLNPSSIFTIVGKFDHEI